MTIPRNRALVLVGPRKPRHDPPPLNVQPMAPGERMRLKMLLLLGAAGELRFPGVPRGCREACSRMLSEMMLDDMLANPFGKDQS